MSEATQPQTQTLEQTLNKTDLGHTIYEYRNIFMGIILAILVGVGAWAIWKQNKESEALDTSVKVFEFQNKIWTPAKDGKMLPADLVKAFSELPNEVQNAPVMVPTGLEIGKFLFEKESLAEAEAILSKLNTAHPVSAFFVANQRSVILEKMGKLDEAIAVLEKLPGSKDDMMVPRINVELGRLSLAKGDKGKAQTHFNYVLTNYPNDEHAKLAKLYLSKMAQ